MIVMEYDPKDVMQADKKKLQKMLKDLENEEEGLERRKQQDFWKKTRIMKHDYIDSFAKERGYHVYFSDSASSGGRAMVLSITKPSKKNGYEQTLAAVYLYHNYGDNTGKIDVYSNEVLPEMKAFGKNWDHVFGNGKLRVIDETYMSPIIHKSPKTYSKR